MRRTRQRELVWTIVRDQGPHLTADEIATEIHKREPRVSRSTVYRALDALTVSGDLRGVRIGDGATVYERGSAGDHQHAVCQNCHAILHLEPELVNELEGHLVAMHRFQPTRTEVLVLGVCDSCARSRTRIRPRRRTIEHVPHAPVVRVRKP